MIASTLAERIAALGFDASTLELERVERCNLCGSTRHLEAARRDRYGFTVRYVVCCRCGLGFLSPRPTAAEYARFYADVYRPLVSAYHGRRIDAETVQEEQREYAAELVPFLEPVLPTTPQTILDVGGSTGVVAGTLRDAFGSAVTVLDPAPDELAVAAAAGMETIGGFAETADLAGLRFDLVLLCQTIDHVIDVAATLGAIRSCLSPAGCAFVDVVDVRCVSLQHGSLEEAVKIDHTYYLTRDTAIGYFDQVGLDVLAERLSDNGHWGFVLAPSTPREPDWDALQVAADGYVSELVWLRAAG